MSEEILKALIQLFAIIAKQGSQGIENERAYVKNFIYKQVQQHNANEYLELFDEKLNENNSNKNSKLTSVKDSVRILKICKKINKKLEYKQKIIVAISLLEMIKTTQSQAKEKLVILDTIADVFNIPANEYIEIKYLVLQDEGSSNKKIENYSNFLFIDSSESIKEHSKHIKLESLHGRISILRIDSANLYFINYIGENELFLNGLPLENDNTRIFPLGATLKLTSGRPIYYSEINNAFLDKYEFQKINYQAKNLHYKFKNDKIGVQDFSISAQQNSLIGILGASGSGKSTLLNIMSGILKADSGQILINSLDLFEDKKELEGILGFIPQDDLLIESLTVFENLYFNAKLCFRNKSKSELNKLIDDLLIQLNLFEIKDLKVGSPLNKLISGGQRKRLNIALELIREPSILFVDEPTSGLSSKDSENVMNLLRELSLKGKLIFVVIHQPSSDIFKMFDNVLIMDEGGHDIAYGNPVDTISYFKKIDGQPAFERAECPSCGNVNPEQVFNIIESEVVDEYGKYSGKRRKSSKDWSEIYKSKFQNFKFDKSKLPLPKTNKIPSKITQVLVYIQRDLKSKLSDKQYILIAMLEAPVLAFILSYLIRYIPQGSEYFFRANENIPQYIFMIVIVALFLGMTISAEEIFKDRKMIKRESFLNLSKSSYLFSKILVLMLISAIQAFLFVVIGNYILEIKAMNLYYFLMFFSISVFSNLLGLNISSAFDNIVTIYILIPLLLIPQMILGGAMFSFDKLNKSLVRIDKVPIVAELMASKWAYEGLMVYQFKDNLFQKNFFELEQNKSQASFYQVYYVPELKKYHRQTLEALATNSIDKEARNNIELLANEANKQNTMLDTSVFSFQKDIESQNLEVALRNYEDGLNFIENYYNKLFHFYNNKYEAKLGYLLENDADLYIEMRNKYHNESLEDILKKTYEKHKIINFRNNLVQNTYPIYQKPRPDWALDIRSQLFSPKKHFLGKYFETNYFNIGIIWLMSILLFLSLRFNLIRRILNLNFLGTITNLKLKSK
jgi:ABC-type multidrug transport system ATPase subunit